MKKLIAAALAASVLTAPVMAAPQHGRNDGWGRTEQNHRVDNRRVVKKTVIVRKDVRRPQVQYRTWQRGQRFESRYARNYRVISNPRQYRLHDAPRGYRWVQSGNDAVLVGIASGIIASVLANTIR
ncbi:RcnB family protein [Sphingomonas jatrophae]|uniref:Regulator RcnB of Ni and Co efflux n=1 Tax=Sphingomonas jatrophae TaxID=1166337 RepID=A0A1I6MA60_9SPHN|nr:RcnB family protein [Sphingomonas jatrophae]SFS12503.1 regulator RcnB of Ni and Co efflux [Sphingomonas jatrophae]